MDRAYEYIIKNGGIADEDSYPYIANEERCQYNPDWKAATLKDYYYVRKNDENDLKAHVGTIGPIAVGIAVPPNFYRYKSGVFYEPECNKLKIVHAVLVVGYGSENGYDYYIVKNSWGKKIYENLNVIFSNNLFSYFNRS